MTSRLRVKTALSGAAIRALEPSTRGGTVGGDMPPKPHAIRAAGLFSRSAISAQFSNRPNRWAGGVFIGVYNLRLHTRSSIMVSMKKLTTDDRVRVIKALVEGCSIRATVR